MPKGRFRQHRAEMLMVPFSHVQIRFKSQGVRLGVFNAVSNLFVLQLHVTLMFGITWLN